MGEIMDAAKAYFDGGWETRPWAGGTMLRMAVRTEAGTWDCYASAREERREFLFYGVHPSSVPAGRRPAMAELLTRVNYGLVLGNFEMDWEDGELRMKTSIDVTGDRLTPALVARLVDGNVRAMSRYRAALDAVIAGASPDEALA